MAKYRFSLCEVHQVNIERFEDFDTTDQKHWSDIIERICYATGARKDDYPSLAPDDPQIWFDTLKELEPSDLKDREDDYWISSSKGTYEIYIKLLDEEGNAIIE